jgi:hypothetical protein
MAWSAVEGQGKTCAACLHGLLMIRTAKREEFMQTGIKTTSVTEKELGHHMKVFVF